MRTIREKRFPRVLGIEDEMDGGKRRLSALLAYWFVRAVATHSERMIYSAWDRVRHGRVDRWAYILVQTDTTDGEDAAMAHCQFFRNHWQI